MRLLLLTLLVLLPVHSLADWTNTPTAINSSDDSSNPHYNSGGRRIVRINGTTFALSVDGNSDHLYRSTNDGSSWSQIDSEGGFSGCLVSGANNYVYHFSRYGGNVRMVKFRYDAGSIPAPVSIATDGGTTHGAYRQLNATVDEAGNLYVFWHDDNGGSYDSLYMVRSDNGGISWTSRITVRAGNGDHSWGAVHSDVTLNGDIVISYSEWESKSIQFAISTNKGTTWNHRQIETFDAYNPSILPVGGSDIYVFAQSADHDGLVFKKSVNSGATWPDNWKPIFGNHGNGYADPSPALGDDGTIYVAFRNAESFTNLSDDLREYVAQSTNNGVSWTFPFKNLSGGRVGTRSVMRYQTWHNYGGPLQWTWLEEVGEDTNNYPTFYNINNNVAIKQRGTAVTKYSLTVTKDETNGLGMVTSSPVGIDCGFTCSNDFDENSNVQLFKTGDLVTWAGDCNSSGEVNMDTGDKECSATFDSGVPTPPQSFIMDSI